MVRSKLVKTVIAAVFGVAIFLANGQSTFAAGVWNGIAGAADPNIRAAPDTESAIVGTIPAGAPVNVASWVHGERVSGVNETWGEIAPGEYVYSANVLKPKPSSPPPAPTTFSGHWIDANLTQQIITAYNGSTPVFWAVMSSGAPGTDTPTGQFTILRRVANETMSSASLAVPVEIPYYLTNVFYTQYFTAYGAAIHDAWWKGADSPFGVPTSHACMGLPVQDALQFWNWAQVGTIVNIHY